MKKLFLLIAVCGWMGAGAQDIVVLRHPNGKPAVKGTCTFFVNPYFSTDVPSVNVRENEQLGRVKDRPFSDYRLSSDGKAVLPDADTPVRLGIGNKYYSTFYGLGFSCDGPVTTFYFDGSKEAEMLFVGGVPSGPYTGYYPNGSVLFRCTLERGMPAGIWTRYYKNGAVYATGRYDPKTAAYLQAAWTEVSPGRIYVDRSLISSAGADRPFTDEGLRSARGDEAEALQAILKQFQSLRDALPLHGTPVGVFTFLARDGSRLADIHFDSAGNRTGVWTIWKVPGKVGAKLEYDREGELMHVIDSAQKRMTVAAYTAHWKKQEEARQRQAPAPSYVIAAPDVQVSEPGVREGNPVVAEAALSRPAEVPAFVDQMPEFVGDLREYVSAAVSYPPEAKSDGIEGQVVIRFIVRADGSITDAKVQRGIGGGCDEEALRVVRAMPKWKPGKQNGKPVAVWFNLPIHFHL